MESTFIRPNIRLEKVPMHAQGPEGPFLITNNLVNQYLNLEILERSSGQTEDTKEDGRYISRELEIDEICYAALTTEKCVGFVILRQVSPALAEVTNLYIEPKSRGKKYGAAIMSALIENIADVGSCRLHVDPRGSEAFVRILEPTFQLAHSSRGNEYYLDIETASVVREVA